MANATPEALIAHLEGTLPEMQRRKGPHSIIAKTIEGSLLSGTRDDLDAGELALNHFLKFYEQLTLDESRRRVQGENERATKLEAKRQAMNQKAAEQETRFKAIEKEESERPKTRQQDVFWDWHLSDGLDFSRHDPLSAGKRRHFVAKAPRSKKRSKATPAPTKRKRK